MSKISTIYDAILTEIGTILSTKTRLPNAYDIENNPVSLIRDGWGLKISGSTGTTGTFCDAGQDRTFTIVLTQEVYRLDTSTSGVDTAVKSILEDVKTLVNGMMASDQIGADSSIDKIDFIDSSEIQLIGAARSHFMSMDVNFSIIYRESLS